MEKSKKTNNWTEEEDLFIKENFPNEGGAFCARKLEKKAYQVIRRAKLLKISKIKLSELIDSNSFIKMDSPESVYIAGFLFADGFCRKKSPQVSLHISRPDMDEIYPTLCKFGPWNYSKYQSNQGRSSYVHTSNKEIYNFFSEMGYKEKSHIEPTKILSYIPENLKYMFWRGFAEGDGTWHFYKPGRGAFSIVAEKEYMWTEFIKMLNNLGIENFGIHRRTRVCGSSSCLSFSRFENLKKFGEYIYQNRENDKIGLSRKYEKFQSIIDEPVILVNEITDEKHTFANLTMAGKFLNTTYITIKKYCENQEVFNGYKIYFNQNKILLTP